MKPVLYGLTLGLLAYTAWLYTSSPHATIAIINRHHIPTLYRTLTKA